MSGGSHDRTSWQSGPARPGSCDLRPLTPSCWWAAVVWCMQHKVIDMAVIGMDPDFDRRYFDDDSIDLCKSESPSRTLGRPRSHPPGPPRPRYHPPPPHVLTEPCCRWQSCWRRTPASASAHEARPTSWHIPGSSEVRTRPLDATAATSSPPACLPALLSTCRVPTHNLDSACSTRTRALTLAMPSCLDCPCLLVSLPGQRGAWNGT